jgi:mannose-6-phosphate isomerase-like protein (cupin superfamily)
MKTRYQEIKPYTTKDGSLIRELLHPARDGNNNQSLAEATLPAGSRTRLHLHRQSEEIYYVTAGWGLMILGGERFEIEVGDSISIPPGTPHSVENRDDAPLIILCCCAPAYSHEDTELLEAGD